jgi:predicted metal-dependent phosphoesterase TrpH
MISSTGARQWYRGDCHVHSTYSTGTELTPEQLAAAARDAGMDFIATTEHNTADAHDAWGPHVRDDLMVILGQEVTTSTGHWLALGVEPGQGACSAISTARWKAYTLPRCACPCLAGGQQ